MLNAQAATSAIVTDAGEEGGGLGLRVHVGNIGVSCLPEFDIRSDRIFLDQPIANCGLHCFTAEHGQGQPDRAHRSDDQ